MYKQNGMNLFLVFWQRVSTTATTATSTTTGRSKQAREIARSHTRCERIGGGARRELLTRAISLGDAWESAATYGLGP